MRTPLKIHSSHILGLSIDLWYWSQCWNVTRKHTEGAEWHHRIKGTAWQYRFISSHGIYVAVPNLTRMTYRVPHQSHREIAVLHKSRRKPNAANKQHLEKNQTELKLICMKGQNYANYVTKWESAHQGQHLDERRPRRLKHSVMHQCDLKLNMAF